MLASSKELELMTRFPPLQRYFLAEILKVSSISPYDLFTLIQARGISPSWNDIALPNGAWEALCPGCRRHENTLGPWAPPWTSC